MGCFVGWREGISDRENSMHKNQRGEIAQMFREIHKQFNTAEA